LVEKQGQIMAATLRTATEAALKTFKGAGKPPAAGKAIVPSNATNRGELARLKEHHGRRFDRL
jgi:hypothetical protein